MKAFKISLLVYLLFHFYLSIAINFSGYSNFSEEMYEDRLNPFGKIIVNEVSEFLTPNRLVWNMIRFPASFSGTYRGYSFFSPNVPGNHMKLLFVADGKHINIPISSSESVVKFETASSNFESNFKNEVLRDKILRSFARWYFNHHPNLEKLDVFFDINTYDNLAEVRKNGYKINNEKVFGFTVRRK